MAISTLLTWWMVPATLALFWVRYLPCHDETGTLIHLTLLVAATGFAVLFQGLARTLRRGRPLRRYKHGGLALLTALIISIVVSLLSFGALTGVPPHLYSSAIPHQIAVPGLVESDIGRLVPRLFTLIGHSPFANLAEAEVSTRMVPWAGQEATTLTLVKGASLKRRNLRYANAIGAFLVNANLREADLSGADLRRADLRGADLEGAVLGGANLQGADLRFASGLTKAQIAAAITDASTRLPDSLAAPTGTAPNTR